jgi:serine/threonine-protein kinase
VIREVDPPPPSRVAGRALQPRLRGDLDAIVMRALHKEPTRRYASVDALSEDLRCYQMGLPVQARRDSLGYRGGKFLRRHRIAAAMAVLVLAALVGGLASTLWQARQARRAAATAQSVTDFLVGLFRQSDPGEAMGRDVTARELLARGRQRLDSALRTQPEVRARCSASSATSTSISASIPPPTRSSARHSA